MPLDLKRWELMIWLALIALAFFLWSPLDALSVLLFLFGGWIAGILIRHYFEGDS